MLIVPRGSKNNLSWEFEEYNYTRYFIYIPIGKNPFKNFTRINPIGHAKAVVFKDMTIRFYSLSWKGLQVLKKEVYKTKIVSLSGLNINRDGVKTYNLRDPLDFLLKNKKIHPIISVPNRSKFFIGFKSFQKHILKNRVVLHLKMPSIRKNINLNSKSWSK